VDLVEVYATVVDARGELVTGLSGDAFQVTEDGAAQRIATFTAGEFPLSVVIGLDRSFSMSQERLDAAATALRAFLGELRAEDQTMVLAIGGEAERLAPLSTDRAASIAALEQVRRWGTTPLYDSIRTALESMEPARGRRALIVLSDGVDRYSGTTAAEIVDLARRTNVLMYPIALGRERPAIFAELATVSGGRSFHAADERQLQTTLSTIGRELRFQYLLGYSPARPTAEQSVWHAIQVSVRRPDVRVRARDGYLGR
jgi:Ca-activated chloride channel family protein